jgi:phospholipase C
VVSPLIQRGTIDHTTYDHTSLLATVERLFGLDPLTRRDAEANDFLHLFTLPEPRRDAPTALPEPASPGITTPRRIARSATAVAADAEPPATFWGAFAVAVRRHASAVPPEHRHDVRQRAFSVQDPARAMALIEEARAVVRDGRAGVW